MRATWYVLEDGSVVDPNDVAPDEDGAPRHKDGVAVAMRGQVPSSCGVDLGEDGKMVESKQMQTGQSGAPYVNREMTAGQGGPLDHDKNGRPGGSTKPVGDPGDVATLRVEYHKVFDKKPFAGWDAATLREKIAAHGKAD